MYVYCTMPLSGADQTRGVDKPWTNTIRRGQRRVIFYSINLWYVNWKCPVYFLVRINVYFIRFLIIYTSFVFSHQDAWYLISSRCAPKGYPSSLVTSKIKPSLFGGRNFIKWVKWLSWTYKHTWVASILKYCYIPLIWNIHVLIVRWKGQAWSLRTVMSSVDNWVEVSFLVSCMYYFDKMS